MSFAKRMPTFNVRPVDDRSAPPAQAYESVPQDGRPVPEEWSTQPEKLGYPLAPWLVFLFFDVLCALTPLVFIVFASLALALNGHDKSAFGQHVFSAQTAGPTIFPIVFAVLVGGLTTNAARWRAERGARLGLLELLAGGHSFGSTVIRAICVRELGVVGILTVLLWAMSPLGGQSSLRLLKMQPSTVNSTADLRYINTNMTFDQLSGAWYGVGPQVAVLLGGALLTSPEVRNSSQDIWGNVKVPLIESLESASANIIDGSSSWHDLNPHTTDMNSYTSLVGLNVVGLPQTGISDFSVESSYTFLDCAPMVTHLTSDAAFNPNGTTSGPNDTVHELIHVLLQPGEPYINPAYEMSTTRFLIDTWLPDWDVGKPNLLFVTYVDPEGLSFTNCSMKVSHVESDVHCNGPKCGVTRMRRSLLDTRPSNITGFATEAGPGYSEMVRENFEDMLGDLPFLVGSAPSAAGNTPLNPMLLYLADPSKNVYTSSATNAGIQVPLANTSNVDFSVRLSQLWNTYTQLLWASNYVTGDAPTNLTVYGNGTQPWTAGFDSANRFLNDDSVPFPNNATTASVVSPGPNKYHASRLWCGILLVIALILQACAIASLVLKYLFCKGPNLLACVSSMTRDNEYMSLPQGGNTMDGLDRARALRDMVVQLGDVNPGSSVGHISLREGAKETLGSAGRHRVYL